MMTHNEGIAQPGDDRGAVFKRLPSSRIRAGSRHVLHADRVGAEGNRCGFKAYPCPGAGLKKEKSNGLAGRIRSRCNTELECFGSLTKCVNVIAVYHSG